MQVQLGNARETSQIDARTKRILGRVLNREGIIIRIQITVKDDVVPDLWNMKHPIHAGMSVTWHRPFRPANWTSQEATNEIREVERISSSASDRYGASESKFQTRQRFEVDFLAVNVGMWNEAMASEHTQELIYACGAKERQMQI